MAKKKLKDCRSGKDFVKFAEKKGAEIRNGKGSHAKVVNEKGMVIIPRHKNDLATGTRRAVINALIAMGIMIFLGFCYAANHVAYAAGGGM